MALGPVPRRRGPARRTRRAGASRAEGRRLHGGGPAAGRRRARRRRRPHVAAALAAFGAPLGEAFQLRDDVRDGEAALGHGRRSVDDLVAQARGRVGRARSIPRRSARSTRWPTLVGCRMSDDLEFLRRAFRDVPTCHVATRAIPTAGRTSRHAVVRLARGRSCGSRRGVGDTTWENALRDPRVSVRDRPWARLGGAGRRPRGRRGGGVPGRAPGSASADVGLAREVPLDVRGRGVRAAHAGTCRASGFLRVAPSRTSTPGTTADGPTWGCGCSGAGVASCWPSLGTA